MLGRLSARLRGAPPTDDAIETPEGLSVSSVAWALGRLTEADWARLGTIEEAFQQMEGARPRSTEIQTRAVQQARRQPNFAEANRSVGLALSLAADAARKAAGPEAAAAAERFEALAGGRHGLVIDPADVPLNHRFFLFRDAANNAVMAAAYREFTSAKEFRYLWGPYSVVLDPVLAARGPELESDKEVDGMWFGPNQHQVVALLSALSDATPAMWRSLAAAQVETKAPEAREWRDRLLPALGQAGAAGVDAGGITMDDVRRAKAMAEDAATKALPGLVDVIAQGSAAPREKIAVMSLELIRSAANAAVTLLLVRPWMPPPEWELAWKPYAEVLRGFGER